MLDELKRITLNEFRSVFANELRQLRDNGMTFVKYERNDTWQRIYFDYDFDWTEDRITTSTIEFIAPLDRDDLWGVHVLRREITFAYDRLKAIANFIDALQKHPFKEIIKEK